MTHIADLEGPGVLKSVGYLARNHNYDQGEVSQETFDCLVKLVKLHLIQWFGHHDCDLEPCGSGKPEPELYYEGLRIPRSCSTDILVPGQAAIYQAPALILHYIRGHHYLPPACFLEAVLDCPQPGSPDYFAALEKLWPPGAPCFW
jgi:hypothetical protein